MSSRLEQDAKIVRDALAQLYRVEIQPPTDGWTVPPRVADDEGPWRAFHRILNLAEKR